MGGRNSGGSASLSTSRTCSSGHSSSCTVTVRASADAVWETICDVASTPSYIPVIVSVEHVNNNSTTAVDGTDSGSSTRRLKPREEGNGSGDDNDDDLEKKADGGGAIPIRVGTMWRETRMYRGRPYVLRKTVTDLTTTPLANTDAATAVTSRTRPAAAPAVVRSIGVHVGLQDEANRGRFKRGTNTSNLTVSPVVVTAVADEGEVANGTSNDDDDHDERCVLVGTYAVVLPIHVRWFYDCFAACFGYACCCWCRQMMMSLESADDAFRSELLQIAAEAERRYNDVHT